MRSSKWALTLVAALVAGCASAPPKTVYVAPPDALLQDCQEPAQGAQTGRGLVTYALDLRDALRGCNAQMEGVRQWVKDAQTPGQK